MCEYCDKDFHNKEVDFGVYIAKKKERYGVHAYLVCIKEYDQYIPINFCPKCGRQLDNF